MKITILSTLLHMMFTPPKKGDKMYELVKFGCCPTATVVSLQIHSESKKKAATTPLTPLSRIPQRLTLGHWVVWPFQDSKTVFNQFVTNLTRLQRPRTCEPHPHAGVVAHDVHPSKRLLCCCQRRLDVVHLRDIASVKQSTSMFTNVT